MAWIVAGAAVLVVVLFAVPAAIHLRETPPPLPPEVRLQIVTPSTLSPNQLALSPDGQRLVFVVTGDGRQRLWLRPLNRTDAEPMAGTDGAQFPFWSADGR